MEVENEMVGVDIGPDSRDNEMVGVDIGPDSHDAVENKDTTDQYSYLEILEENDLKREGWSYFIPYDKTVTIDHLDELEECLNETETFSLASYCLTRETVDYLISRNDIEPNSYSKRFKLKDYCILTGEIVSNFCKGVDTERIDENWIFGNISFKVENVNRYYDGKLKKWVSYELNDNDNDNDDDDESDESSECEN